MVLFDVFLSIHFVVSSLSQIKHILGLADQHAHALTFECVRLCSEGKILFFLHTRSNFDGAYLGLWGNVFK